MERNLRRGILGSGLAVAALALAVAVAGPAAAQGSGDATLTILHGLPRFTADVYVNGELSLDGFEPESLTEPIHLPAGTYDVAIRDVGAAATSTPALEATVTLHAGRNYSAIAHLDGGGSPSLALFRNDLSPVAPGSVRFVVRNTADAGAIRVRLDGRTMGGAVAEGGERTSEVTPGRYSVTVLAADGSTLLSGTSVTLAEGTQGVVYLVGSASEDTLALMVQSFDGLASAPGDILTGTAPLPGRRVPAGAVAIAFAVGAAASAALIARRRTWAAATCTALSVVVVAAGLLAGGPASAATSLGSVPSARRVATAAARDAVDAPIAAAGPPIAVRSARLADAPTPRTGPAPTRIRFPSLGLAGPVVPVGIQPGTDDVAIPNDVDTVGWYRFGARPGGAGSSVLVGHVSSGAQGAGLFSHLRDLRTGARVVVEFADGSQRPFVVRARRDYPKADLPADLFARAGAARLILVTCGGPFDVATGHYEDNVVVYAVPAATS